MNVKYLFNFNFLLHPCYNFINQHFFPFIYMIFTFTIMDINYKSMKIMGKLL